MYKKGTKEVCIGVHGQWAQTGDGLVRRSPRCGCYNAKNQLVDVDGGTVGESENEIFRQSEATIALRKAKNRMRRFVRVRLMWPCKIMRQPQGCGARGPASAHRRKKSAVRDGVYVGLVATVDSLSPLLRLKGFMHLIIEVTIQETIHKELPLDLLSSLNNRSW